MEYKLSNHQVRVLASLGQQKKDAQKIVEEIAEAESEVLSMIIKYADLPIGAYYLTQTNEGVFLKSKDD